jgi:hypothetical protein
LRNLVKGYGDTFERGHVKYRTIAAFMSGRLHHPAAAMQLRALIAAAGKDEDGAAIRTELDRLDLNAVKATVATVDANPARQAG